MAKTLLGEIGLHIHGKRYALRPSFGALYEIEQQLGTTIPELICDIKDKKASVQALRAIWREGFAASYGETAPCPELSARQLRRLWPVALAFLIQGLGYMIAEEAPASHAAHALPGGAPAPESSVAPSIAEAPPAAPGNAAAWRFEPLRWEDIYDSARTILGVGEREFWHMTMPGLSRMAAAVARMQGIDSGYGGVPATASDLTAMMAQFPDAPPE